MQYVARLPHLPSTRTILGLVAALVLGAGVAIGAYALIDDGGTQSTQYIVVEQPAQGSADIPGKNEAATAAAIGSGSSSAATIAGKDEAATAAAISKSDNTGSSSVDLRGSKASSSSTAGTSSQTSDDGGSSSATPFGGHR
jgi:hypothetical protein